MTRRTWCMAALLLAAASHTFGFAWPEAAGGLYEVIAWFNCERSGGLWGCSSPNGFSFYASRAFVIENIILAGCLVGKWRKTWAR